ncbi:glycosyltransferase family 2 protein [Klebsiella quasipneumoniae]|uniref:glycosyltransferase family 2 protein n=1 Tax=Klebsiella quasipneumoniae TaxID=1463165 RepID=UPI00388D8522
MFNVSVVIPVYNASEYIDRCISSIMGQTLSNFEVVVIDDGSTDGSLKIIEDALRRYERNDVAVLVTSRNNRGVSFTRSEGLKKARGKYLIFLDSDDWVEKKFLEVLYKKAVSSDLDMVVCDYYLEYPGRSKLVTQEFIGNNIDFIESLLLGELGGFSWNKLIRRDVYQKYDINFVAGINYLEDLIFITHIALKSSRIELINIPLVHYNQSNINSITKIVSKDSIESMILAVGYMEDLLNSNGVYTLLQSALNFQKMKRKLVILKSLGFVNKNKIKYLTIYSEISLSAAVPKISIYNRFY